MTHLNIGATLACAAWVIWTGAQVVGGQWPMPRPAAGAPGIGLPATSDRTCPCGAPRAADRPDRPGPTAGLPRT